MQNFLKGLKMKLRFQTVKGVLSMEELPDLSLTDLDTLAVKLETEYKNSKGKSFIQKRTKKDKDIKLKFDIVLTILQDKLEEEEDKTILAENKKHNEKIFDAIERAEENVLASKSPKELRKMLK